MELQTVQDLLPRPTSVEAALAALQALGPDALPLAGATWAMRAPLRHEVWPRPTVSLQRIAELHKVDLTPSQLWIGAMVTHDQLARTLGAVPDLHGLAAAAGKSANPGVRRLATVGGNLCSATFAAADLVPALLAAGATVDVCSGSGRETLSLLDFLLQRSNRPRPWLITGVHMARNGRLSAHERLTMRQAGDYPCAIVSLSLAVDLGGRISDARIAVGAVEPVARRWHTLEHALQGRSLQATDIEAKAAGLTGEFQAREGTDAPGWYRISVLPVLVRRGIASIRRQFDERRRP